MKIYVGNLSYNTTESGLRELFEGDGGIDTAAIKAVDIVTDRSSGRSKGFGFVVFNSEDAMEAALKLNGAELDGRALTINMAREREDRQGGRGEGGRGGRR